MQNGWQGITQFKKMKVFRKIILWIFETAVYRWLLLHLVPYIRFSCYYTSFRGWRYQRGYKFLSPGDIILTNDAWKLTSFLIPGVWTHAALCVTRDSEFEIAEMTHTDFTRSTFFDLCKEATRIAIFRCQEWDAPYIKQVIAKCLSFQKCKYDIAFSQGPEALYCSELIIESDFEHRLKASNEDIHGLGMLYVSPTGISKATNIVKIWDSDDETQPTWDDEIQMETT